MAKLPVVQAPAEVLNKISKPVNFKEKNLRQLILDMVETLEKHNDPPGVGLAAPQIGVNLRIFMALLGTNGEENDLKNGHIEIFINPEILNSSDQLVSSKDRRTAEGCLSLKRYYGQVIRSPKVSVKYQTLDISKLKNSSKSTNFEPLQKTSTFTGFEARIMQHEIDHLNGRLFTSRVLEQQGKLYLISNQKGEETWEEVSLEI